jgi:LacI family transcriptional regulator
VGFDDISLADVVEPAVTVVAQDPAAMGRKAAELLFRRIDGDGGAPAEVIVPTPLVVRGSGEIAP